MLQTVKSWFQDLLEKDLQNLPRWKRFCFRAVQIFYASVRDIADGQLSLRAMSLVYSTLIAIVPLLAISFSVLKGFGVHNRIEPTILSFLEGLGEEKSMEVAEKVIGFVDNIKVGVLGAVGLALLIYVTISLMQKIETAFNYIWRVGRDRTIAQRFSNYLSVLFMGPLLILVSAGITTTVRHSPMIKHFSETSMFEPLYGFTAWFIPWVVMACGFTFFYIYMPNTKVRISAAFSGAMVAALLWKLMGYVFASFIAGSANYVAIYAAFATLIILLIWLYASWLVVLIGCNVSFYVQYPRYLRVSRENLILSPYLKMVIGLTALTEIAKSHYKHQAAWTADTLSKKLNIPILALQKSLNALEKGKIIIADQHDPPQYFPACPLDATPLQKAVDALEKHGREGWLQTERMHFAPEALKVIKDMNAALLEKVTSQTIAQALLAEEDLETSAEYSKGCAAK